MQFVGLCFVGVSVCGLLVYPFADCRNACVQFVGKSFISVIERFMQLQICQRDCLRFVGLCFVGVSVCGLLVYPFADCRNVCWRVAEDLSYTTFRLYECCPSTIHFPAACVPAVLPGCQSGSLCSLWVVTLGVVGVSVCGMSGELHVGSARSLDLHSMARFGVYRGVEGGGERAGPPSAKT